MLDTVIHSFGDHKSAQSRPAAGEFLPGILQDHARRRGDHPAVIMLEEPGPAAPELVERRLTYRRLEERSRALAAVLRRHCSVGDRALLVYPTCEAFVIAFLACLRSGVVAVPVPAPEGSHHGGRRRAMVAADCGARVVLTTTSLAQSLDRGGEPEGVRPRYLATDGSEVEHDDPAVQAGASWADLVPDAGSLAFLQYTSGSTSEPKGVRVSHGNLRHNQRQLRAALDTGRSTVTVAWLPMYHDMGLIGALLHPLYVGGTVVLMDSQTFLRRPERWLWAVDRYRASFTVGPDFAYRLVARRAARVPMPSLDLTCLRTALNGAEPIDPHTVRSFTDAFAGAGLAETAMSPCYGLAEATLYVTGHRPGEPARTTRFDRAALEAHRLTPAGPAPAEPTSVAAPLSPVAGSVIELVGCGRPVDADVLVVDPQSRQPLLDGRVGEIWVRGDNVALGYWGRPDDGAPFDATTSTGEGGFLRTGDLGGIHSGDLYVTGRLKDMIIVNGRNIYPQDVEHVAGRADPAVAGCAAAAFAPASHPTRVVLVTELRTPADGDDVDRAAVADRIRQAVWDEVGIQLGAVVLVDRGRIPRTTSGKVRRSDTAAQYDAGALTGL